MAASMSINLRRTLRINYIRSISLFGYSTHLSYENICLNDWYFSILCIIENLLILILLYIVLHNSYSFVVEIERNWNKKYAIIITDECENFKHGINIFLPSLSVLYQEHLRELILYDKNIFQVVYNDTQYWYLLSGLQFLTIYLFYSELFIVILLQKKFFGRIKNPGKYFSTALQSKKYMKLKSIEWYKNEKHRVAMNSSEFYDGLRESVKKT